MKPPEQLKQRVLTEKRVTARLRMATTRVEEAEQERIWAVATAHSSGLSIRKIAAATGLSSSRVHQLLMNHVVTELIQQWLETNEVHSIGEGKGVRR